MMDWQTKVLTTINSSYIFVGTIDSQTHYIVVLKEK